MSSLRAFINLLFFSSLISFLTQANSLIKIVLLLDIILLALFFLFTKTSSLGPFIILTLAAIDAVVGLRVFLSLSRETGLLLPTSLVSR